MAVGAVGALRTRGLSVPGDVSVVGFDDVFFAEASDPPLTSVRQPRREIGRAAMAMMIGRLGGEAPPDRIMAGVELVVRASSAPPPAETGSGTRTARRS
jgi:LacI family repressor for deo operon, udp, cdd, tsx, nupC, and nupG